MMDPWFSLAERFCFLGAFEEGGGEGFHARAPSVSARGAGQGFEVLAFELGMGWRFGRGDAIGAVHGVCLS